MGKRTKAVEVEAPAPVAAERPKRSKAPFYVAPDVLERARDAVYWTPGLTLGDLFERGALLEIARLEKERGEAFPSRPGELRAGRPVGR